jgi:AraC family transcriptional regulator
MKSVDFKSDRKTNIFSELPRLPIVSSSELDWKTIQIIHFRQPAFEIREHQSDSHGICLNAGKAVKLEQKIADKLYKANSIPGDFSIYPAQVS